MYRIWPLLLISLAGCSHAPPLIVTPAEPHVQRGEGIPIADFSAIEAVDRAKAASWRNVVDAARAVISSDDFAEAVKSRTLEARSRGSSVSGEDVLRMYRGESATRGQILTQYALTTDGCGGQTASTGIYRTDPNGGYDHAIVTLNTCTLARATDATDVYAFACAVNTAAHELTHSVIVDGEQPYQDGGHQGDRHPMVSYTLGAIAQCVYLEHADKLPGSFDACVTRIGGHSFDAGTCCADWSKGCAR